MKSLIDTVSTGSQVVVGTRGRRKNRKNRYPCIVVSISIVTGGKDRLSTPVYRFKPSYPTLLCYIYVDDPSFFLDVFKRKLGKDDPLPLFVSRSESTSVDTTK